MSTRGSCASSSHEVLWIVIPGNSYQRPSSVATIEIHNCSQIIKKGDVDIQSAGDPIH